VTAKSINPPKAFSADRRAAHAKPGCPLVEYPKRIAVFMNVSSLQ